MMMLNSDGDDAVGVENGGDGKMLRWERLIPRGSLRVLLVESDESTRQVIAALLKKCCYKVAAVSDGLAAWEVLKRRPNDIDLILTEVELPSISGFALLTLIMEHNSCKSIPVIMMSKNDSVNMAYKCMLRGAADFLVKPVRKNELQNLWQHVWRRQANASGGRGVQDESITQPKIEGLLDNDLKMDELNGACTPENEECNEKGNDAQSSCSLPGADGVMMSQQEDLGCTKLHDDRNTLAEASDNNDAFISGSREAMDLIGTFQNHSAKSRVKFLVINGIKDHLCPRLNLSLRSYDDSRGHQETSVAEGRNIMHRSNASAFSGYEATKPIHRAQENTQLREYGGSSIKHISGPIEPIDFRIINSHLNTQTSSVNQESSDSRRGERPSSGPQLRMLPVTVQANGVRLDRMCTSNSSSLHPSSPTPSPDSGGQREMLSRVMPEPNPNTGSCINQMALRQDENSETMEHMKNISSERSQNSSLSNAVASRLKGLSNGSSSNPIEGISTQDENTYRSSQRAEALNKFRLKRKDRCFEKKVRYEKRKKLAEQRPRVKGQFVRQRPTDPSTVTTADLSIHLSPYTKVQ